MQIATSSLNGTALDFAVAAANFGSELSASEFKFHEYRPTQNWQAALSVVARNAPEATQAMVDEESTWGTDPSSAGMNVLREYVRSKLGDNVEVPDELITP